jgi:hypothetical protein
MLQAKGPIGILRGGVLVPAGTLFNIPETEAEELRSRGFQVSSTETIGAEESSVDEDSEDLEDETFIPLTGKKLKKRPK